MCTCIYISAHTHIVLCVYMYSFTITFISYIYKNLSSNRYQVSHLLPLIFQSRLNENQVTFSPDYFSVASTQTHKEMKLIC